MLLHLAPGLIDIHCHLLPGLDDGPRTLDASAEMCAVAHAAGTTAIVATPHANHRFPFRPAEIETRRACLQQRAPHPLQVFTGCEMEMSLEAFPDALWNRVGGDGVNRDAAGGNGASRVGPNGNGVNGGGYTLNGSRYLLVEVMPAGTPAHLDRVFARLLERGVTPVVAHPERNAHLQRHVERLAAWVEQGCLTQLTANSITGRLGPRVQAIANELLRRRLVHFIASDAHDPVRRPPRLVDAYRLVSRDTSPELAELLFVSNPRAVLEDREIRAWPAY